jgi:hypothetical protein
MTIRGQAAARLTAPTSTELTEAVARAAYAIWRYNGHDVITALDVVYRRALDPAVRQAAGEEHFNVLDRRVVREAYEMRFEAWLAGER